MRRGPTKKTAKKKPIAKKSSAKSTPGSATKKTLKSELERLFEHADALEEPRVAPIGAPRISPAKRQMVIELHRSRPGLTSTQIAKLVGDISAGSIHNILRNMRATTAAGSGPRSAREADEEDTSHTAEEDADGGEIDGETNVERLEALSRQLIRDADMLRKTGDFRDAAGVQDRCVRVLERLGELRPPPPKDPETDPLNVAARTAVVARVRAIVEREEAGRAALEQFKAAP